MTTYRDAIQCQLEHAGQGVEQARAALAAGDALGVGVQAAWARQRLDELFESYGQVTTNMLDHEAT